MKKIIVPFASALLGGIIALTSFSSFQNPNNIQDNKVENHKPIYNHQAAFRTPVETGPDLTLAAEKSLQSVVHVRMIFKGQQQSSGNPIFDMLYGRPHYRPTEGTGSGVIISDDGYIVTNNHVVNGAQELKITLNNKDVYTAKVIGKDPSTDLALIKIDAENLPYINYANSENIKVGEWVLAVGNPFNLKSTVTAGIISAKGRDINILASDPQSGISPVESFIQTDAAVNPGNSGGALVNSNGELIGINAAIKSNTGSFTGYSFAIPSNIVKKVVLDLMEFGVVQRAFIGVAIQDISEQLAKNENLNTKDGIYVAGLSNNGSAIKAGIEKGDIITAINEKQVNNIPELQEQISAYRPGDEIKVTYLRKGELRATKLVLRNQYGSTKIVESNLTDINSILGANISMANDKVKRTLGISYGVQIVELKAGKLMKAGIRETFIIRKVDGKIVNTPNDVTNALYGKIGGVLFEGIYPNGRRAYYGVGV